MPPSAASTRPAWSRTAPVNAPRAWPKSSLASSSSESVGQFTTTNGRSRRGESEWSIRASTPFPVPLSPRSSTETSWAAAFSTTSMAARIRGEAVSSRSSGEASPIRDSRSRSRRSISRRSSVLDTTCWICAGENGFGR